jgi:small-conductance mechanosensitive channel
MDISSVKRGVCRAFCTAVTTAGGVMAYAVNGMASNTASSVDDVAQSITGPMNSLINVILAVLACVGVFMLVKSISELVNSIQQQDNSGIFHAARGIAAALLMISIKLIVKLFGYDL